MAGRHLGGALFLAAVIVVSAAWWLTPLGDQMTLAALWRLRDGVVGAVHAWPLLSIGVFFVACMGLTSLCFPAAPLIGLAAGSLFGFWTGLALVLSATTLGSTVACLLSRTLLRDWAAARLGNRMVAVERGFAAHGPAYLLALRFNPVIPYWLVNLLMGLTCMRLSLYVPLTAVGLVPATLIYVEAGTQLAAIDSVGDILSPTLLAMLLVLCLCPLVVEALRVRMRAAL